MQIVIDIPDDTFETLNRKKNLTIDELIILNGIPLPKGHGRLGDIDKVRTELDWLEKVTNEGSIVEQAAYRKLIQCINIVNAAPTIIEADKAGDEE